ncbi:MAG: rod shape-determining protein MreC [candidate division KSB1 bacterium]|nr:rod shape-determining protein MreC [candidate division KSB1 bacterium]MDZ7319165.1 rod shape-determining protein MreC [candidate division KSB1 bacterium]MDZ7341430.1 rod shape-determining protein MreC [candidate division KSB1 bacterium]
MFLYRNFPAFRDYTLLMLLIVAALVIISGNHNPQIEHFKMWMIGWMGWVQEKWYNIEHYWDYKQQNEQLRLENTRLALENSFAHEMRLENERLRQLIGFRQTHAMDMVAARVIGRGSRRSINSIVLDVGREDGVAKNMPLVVAEGLVGKIYQVGASESVGQLLLDQNFRVGAKIQRSRVVGILRWGGTSEICYLNEVPQRADVQVGDTVITSGYSDIFPAGLKIGLVVQTTPSAQGLFREIQLKPFVNFDKLEETFVIREKASQP